MPLPFRKSIPQNSPQDNLCFVDYVGCALRPGGLRRLALLYCVERNAAVPSDSLMWVRWCGLHGSSSGNFRCFPCDTDISSADDPRKSCQGGCHSGAVLPAHRLQTRTGRRRWTGLQSREDRCFVFHGHLSKFTSYMLVPMKPTCRKAGILWRMM